MATTNAHAASFPLFMCLQRFDGEKVAFASEKMTEVVEALDLSRDVSVIVLIHEERTIVSMESASSFGDEILAEVLHRTTLPPCPDGECEDGGRAHCKWCGMPLG